MSQNKTLREEWEESEEYTFDLRVADFFIGKMREKIAEVREEMSWEDDLLEYLK